MVSVPALPAQPCGQVSASGDIDCTEDLTVTACRTTGNIDRALD